MAFLPSVWARDGVIRASDATVAASRAFLMQSS